MVPCCLSGWLTFWFVYSIVAFAKSILDYVSVIIPFYEEAYIAFIISLGFFGGADIIYSQLLRPFLKEHEALIDEKCVALPLASTSLSLCPLPPSFLSLACGDLRASTRAHALGASCCGCCSWQAMRPPLHRFSYTPRAGLRRPGRPPRRPLRKPRQWRESCARMQTETAAGEALCSTTELCDLGPQARRFPPAPLSLSLAKPWGQK